MEALLADEGARVMWVGAHPDDETLAAPILARACLGLKRPCLFLVLTRGEGGRCPFKEGCHPSLGVVRAGEMKRVAEAYGAELEHLAFWNAPLPEESFPPRPEIYARWRRQADPVAVAARAIRRFRPTLILTFDPHRGFTGHPEHQLASRVAMAAARRAADPKDRWGGEDLPYATHHLYQVLNRFWLTALGGSRDPTEPTETFDTHVACGPPGRTCLDVALELTRFHQTQVRDMGRVRSLRPQIGELYLRHLDPQEGELPSPADAP